LNPDSSAQLSDLNFLSPDGVCHSFDQKANGYSRGEGVSVLVLKRLSQAIEHGDTVRGIVRATGCNQDGRTPGITQPSSQSQERLIRETYSRANLDPSQTRFFEAHGTGTPVGDPLEASAISRVFTQHRTKEDPIYVGAVKSNIGHLEGASGLAGVVKTLLALERGVIPPNVYPESPETVNPKIATECDNIAFPTSTIPWPQRGIRRASVNSFGFGGTNAHVVLDDVYHFCSARNLPVKHRTRPSDPIQNTIQEPLQLECEKSASDSSSRDGADLSNSVGSTSPGREISPRRNSADTTSNSSYSESELEDNAPLRYKQPEFPILKLLTLSTFEEGGVQRTTSAHDEWLRSSIQQKNDMPSLDDLAYTLCDRRSLLPWRSATVATNNNLDRLEWSPPVRARDNMTICFLFTGQGAQWHNMGSELLQYPVFRSSLEKANTYFKSLGSRWSLIDELYIKSKESSRIDAPECSQPICTALQVAIIDLLHSWNIRPSVTIGHSSGEIAAAYAAKAISKSSAWMISYYRGLAVSMNRDLNPSPGAMISIQQSPENAKSVVDEHNNLHPHDTLDIACYNSPGNVTVSGSWEAVDRIAAMLTNAGMPFKLLNVDVAYHSHYMNTVAVLYERLLRKISHGKTPSDPPQFFSSVTGERLESTNRLRTAEYWMTNLVGSVQFSKPMTQLFHASQASQRQAGVGPDFIVEIGPHSALRGPVNDIFRSLGLKSNDKYGSVLMRNRPANATAIECAAKLHCIGYTVDLSAVNQTHASEAKTLPALPYYPFNHQKKYWQESRLSKGIRFRRFPPHELLGTRVSDWNELEARWNNRIILSEKPYWKDHQVNGLVLYPAAGMLVMAIEAIRQMTDNASGKIQGYRIRDVSFSKAIVISSNPQGTETQLTLRPSNDRSSKSAGAWSVFTVFVYEADSASWSECCRGAITVEHEEPVHPFAVDEQRTLLETKMEQWQRGRAQCQFDVDVDKAYDIVKTSGIEYGPSFRGMQHAKWDRGNQATATVDMHYWRAHTESPYCEPHVIHPATLDALFQLILLSRSNGGEDTFPTSVPTRLFNAWISADLLDAPADAKLIASSVLKKESFRTHHASIIVAQVGSDRPCLTGEMEMSTVADASPSSSGKNGTAKHLFNIVWKPDIDLLRGPLPLSDFSPNPEPRIEEKEALCLASINAALVNLKGDIDALPVHLQRYIQWAKWQTLRHEKSSLPTIENLLTSVENHDVEGMVLARVARNLDAILTRGADALGLLFADDIMAQYYLNFSTTPILMSQTASHVDLLAHKCPTMRILEIGAGTGCMTKYILEMLGDRMEEYVFTDISSGFFAKSKEKFHDKKISFKVLDISKDPQAQAFDLHSFDLIIAGNVLHATNSIPQALCNVHKLLKTGGHLILFENVNRTMMRGGFIFGLLPGWWNSPESVKNLSPLFSNSEWNDALLETDFSGIDLCISDAGYESREAVQQIMITTAVRPDRKEDVITSPRKFSIVVYEQSPVQLSLQEALSLGIALREQVDVSVVPWQDVEASAERLAGSVCVFLPGIDDTLLESLDQSGLERLRTIIVNAQALVWVSFQGQDIGHSPKEAMAQGLARTIHSEYSEYRFITLNLEKHTECNTAVHHILSVTSSQTLSDSSGETEYCECEGVLCISRVVENRDLAGEVFPDLENISTVPVQWKDIGNAHLSITQVGFLDKMYYIEMLPETAPLSPGEIEIEVRAVGLNFRDVLTALGQVNGNYFGNECAGVINRMGPSTNNRFKVGDRVVGVTEKTMSKFCRCFDHQVQKIPVDMGYNEAASYAVAYCTAYYGLVHWARIRKGESVLIHSGAGGFGQAAIQLARHFECEIFVTVGASEKALPLSKAYGIPLTHFFSSRNLEFAKGIKRMTNGRGVDVILNSLAGEALRQSWDCIAPFGRFIEVGKKDIYAPPVTTVGGLPMLPFSRNCLFASVDLPQVAMRSDFSELLGAVMELAEKKIITPPQPLHVFKQSEMEKAFRFMQTGKHTGKIVLDFDRNEVVQVRQAARDGRLFKPDATYLVAGAFGGIGKSIAKWMVKQGAKNLILPSRSVVEGAKNSRAAFVQDLRARGVRVEAPLCDISKREQLKEALDSLCGMPPIQGCIQSAMILQDNSFQNMTESQWQTAIAPKVAGSWNLHELLPKELSFFIMLASQAGIAGPFGQSNYAAGNTYQDALAQHRNRHGLPAISIDLGTVASVGYVAENKHVKAMMRARGVLEDLSEEDVLSLLKHYCSIDGIPRDERSSQVITHLPIPSELRAHGIVEPPHLSRPLLRHLHTIIPSSLSSPTTATASIKPASALLQAAKSLDEASDIITEAIRTQLASLLVIEKENVDPSRPIHSYGVDSLVAIEMQNWFAKGVGVNLSVMEILGANTIRNLAAGVARKSSFVSLEAQV
jgi:acyl transferase domain-containing protein/NADPH:quinone reductase-like Zn-dependent oxidoreductase/NAD(P)-dependent dehydrogenase (short-subunit alcohol dehydrogenase family)/aryl carrier-like protein